VEAFRDSNPHVHLDHDHCPAEHRLDSHHTAHPHRGQDAQREFFSQSKTSRALVVHHRKAFEVKRT
jgi:hypothetical protein